MDKAGAVVTQNNVGKEEDRITKVLRRPRETGKSRFRTDLSEYAARFEDQHVTPVTFCEGAELNRDENPEDITAAAYQAGRASAAEPETDSGSSATQRQARRPLSRATACASP